jgi:hypothetical protein
MAMKGIYGRRAVRKGGTTTTQERPERLWFSTPAAPNRSAVEDGICAFVFTCPYTYDAIVAAAFSCHEERNTSYTCYYTFPTEDAAIMFALATN